MTEERKDSWEYTGRSVDEAVEKALEELGVEKTDVEIEVIEEPQKGFLGLGGKEAKIRVSFPGGTKVGREGVSRQASGERREPQEAGGMTEESVAVRSLISNILRLMKVEATIEIAEKEDSIIVDIWGEDVALLIGRGGNTLEALQTLVNICASKRVSAGKKVVVDVEGYRKRRKSRIEKQAQDKAREALEKGKSELPPMSAADRKIVHLTLRDFRGVRTESVGEEPERRVVIYADKIGKADVSRETETVDEK